MRVEYFEFRYLQYLAENYFGYYAQYKCFPSFDNLITLVRDSLRADNDDVLKNQVVGYLGKVRSNPNVNDLPYVKDQALDFCRKQAIKESLERIVDNVENANYDEIVDDLNRAVNKGSCESIGHNFEADRAARFVEDERHAVRTGIPELDAERILRGGLGRGELGVVVAPTGVGKCSRNTTYMDIQHEQIIVNGITYNPWDKILTARGTIAANEIKRNIVERRVQMGDLFNEMGCKSTSADVDQDGDTVRDIRQYSVKVKTLDNDNAAWQQIEAIRWTKPEELFRVTTPTSSLDCADKHLVYVIERCPNSELPAGWRHIEKLQIFDKIATKDGPQVVTHLKKLDREPERLCDLQVANTHSYLSNDILSHNSHALVHFGAQALLDKKNVNHYTMELSENAIGLRYDSHLTGIESNKVPAYKDEVMRLEDEMNLGKLMIKGYPTGTATIQTLRAHIERCILQGHKPDVLLIDYADIMRSTRKYDAPRFELKLIYEELRNLAMTFDIPIWTASQANRDAANADVVGLENMSEAYGKAMVADVVISLSRKPEEKASGFGRLFVAKNRAGNDGIVYPAKINTATSTISVLEGADSLSLLETQQNDERSLKATLREKWGQIRKDKTIPTKPLPKTEVLETDAAE